MAYHAPVSNYPIQDKTLIIQIYIFSRFVRLASIIKKSLVFLDGHSWNEMFLRSTYANREKDHYDMERGIVETWACYFGHDQVLTQFFTPLMMESEVQCEKMHQSCVRRLSFDFAQSKLNSPCHVYFARKVARGDASWELRGRQ